MSMKREDDRLKTRRRVGLSRPDECARAPYRRGSHASISSHAHAHAYTYASMHAQLINFTNLTLFQAGGGSTCRPCFLEGRISRRCLGTALFSLIASTVTSADDSVSKRY